MDDGRRFQILAEVGRGMERQVLENFWHRFIDHLAADKDAESFFKELDSKAQERPDSHH